MQKIWLKNTFLFFFTVGIVGGVGRFVPVVMVVVERGDAKGVFGLFSNISALQSVILHCIMHQLGENDS
jgi:hypothetical protein